MTREDDKRVAEIMGWTFWSELRGRDGEGYLVHLVWGPGRQPPYRSSRDWEAQMHRYKQLTLGEFRMANCINADILPRFTSDPAADYTVLEWVRLAWIDDPDAMDEFPEALARIIGRATDKSGIIVDSSLHGFLEFYQPGDYSRALLELDKKGVLK